MFTEKDRERREFILKDLSARLPYGVICHYNGDKYYPEADGMLREINSTKYAELVYLRGLYLQKTVYDYGWRSPEDVRPYLRSLKDMTSEEKEFLKENNITIHVSSRGVETSIDGFEWLNKNHYDYRGLIEKGLAIRVTEYNNPYSKSPTHEAEDLGAWLNSRA